VRISEALNNQFMSNNSLKTFFAEQEHYETTSKVL